MNEHFSDLTRSERLERNLSCPPGFLPQMLAVIGDVVVRLRQACQQPSLVHAVEPAYGAGDEYYCVSNAAQRKMGDRLKELRHHHELEETELVGRGYTAPCYG